MTKSNFLRDQAKTIVEKHRNELEHILIVLPNKRAITYLNKSIASFFTTPFFSPNIITIYDWAKQNSSQRIASTTELLLIMHEVHLEIEGEDADNINEFIKWGGMLVSDFDEIERYQVSPEAVFKDLRNIKEVEHWSLGEDNLSTGQSKFLKFWMKLPKYYTLYNEKLLENGIENSGKAYQKLKDSLADIAEQWKHIYFVGFNALSKVEEEIMFGLRKMKVATMAFDMDAFYTDQPDHEANYFYDKFKQNYNLTYQFENNFSNSPKEIKIIEADYPIQQVSAVSELLKEYNNVDSLAVVLADESLVLPVVRSLPQNIQHVNVTLGFPFFHTNFGSFLEQLFELQFSFQKFKSSRLYYKTLMAFIDQPWIHKFITKTDLIKFEADLVEKNKVFIGFEDFIAEFPALKKIEALFIRWEDFVNDGMRAIEVLRQSVSEELKNNSIEDKLEAELFRMFELSIFEASKFMKKYTPDFDLKSFKRSLIQFFKEQDLAFFGNPTEGLQIMGILETRTLDFDHVIVVGLNEGNLPRTNFAKTFIPRDLRKHHDLPCEEDRQAIFAHHFYRLIQRANKIDLMYVNSEEGINAKEQSRYINQLKNDLDEKTGHSIEEMSISSPAIESIDHGSFKQTPASLSRLQELLAVKGLSPSALNKYVTCPKDFYYKYVLGLKEEEDVDESIDSSTFGTQIHEVLEVIFKENFLDQNKPLDAGTIAGIIPNLEDLLYRAYEKDNFSKSDLEVGKNRLAFDVSLNLLEKFLKAQIKEIKATPGPIEIVALEQQLEAFYPIEIQGKTVQLKIHGTVDRIDKINGKYRIIDYKSGKSGKDKIEISKGNKKHLEDAEKLDKINTFFEDAKKGHGRQLAMYSLMFAQNNPEIKEFTAGIIAMVNIEDWVLTSKNVFQDNEVLDAQILAEFENCLMSQVNNLVNEKTEFAHDEAAKYCDFC